MHLHIQRFKEDEHSTIGFLTIDDKPMFFTLEDAYHEDKIAGKTRIPSGTYPIKFRNEGGMTKRYASKFGTSFHKGMLWLQDVPNFEWIYLHPGNTADHTEGCILVGMTVDSTIRDMKLGDSIEAYRIMYNIVREALLNEEEVVIEITDVAYL